MHTRGKKKKESIARHHIRNHSCCHTVTVPLEFFISFLITVSLEMQAYNTSMVHVLRHRLDVLLTLEHSMPALLLWSPLKSHFKH